jgi:hypothetical protein
MNSLLALRVSQEASELNTLLKGTNFGRAQARPLKIRTPNVGFISRIFRRKEALISMSAWMVGSVEGDGSNMLYMDSKGTLHLVHVNFFFTMVVTHTVLTAESLNSLTEKQLTSTLLCIRSYHAYVNAVSSMAF